MIPLSVAQVAVITGAALDQVADPEVLVSGPVVIDSREARPGSLFVALPGTRTDGHQFAAAAVAAGAAAVLAARPVGVPALIVPDVQASLGVLARGVLDLLPQVTVVGITGSVGKTSTKDFTAQLVERLGPTIAPRNSFNNEIGHPLTVLRCDEHTRFLITELSARGPGHITALCKIAPPRLGAVLCVGHAHAGEFGGIEEIAKAKGELPAALPPDGVAVLNADDRRVLAMAARTRARVVTFGRSADADVRAVDVSVDEMGRPAFSLKMETRSLPVTLRLHGEHQVQNALAAAALARELGMQPEQIAAGLSAAVARSKWRMEVTERPDGVTVVNDAYNANPESMRAALAALAAMTVAAPRGDDPPRPPRIRSSGRRGFAVLGEMTELGELAGQAHEAIGAAAALAGVAGLIVIGDAAAGMLDGAKSVPSWHGELLHVPDQQAALDLLTDRLSPGDVVLVKASHSIGLERLALALAGAGGVAGGRPLSDAQAGESAG